MAEEVQEGLAARASGRAKGEIARARDVRFGTGQSILAGLFIGWVGIATKAALNEAIGDTGYIVLMAAVVLAAWFGGLAGGITAVITAVVLNTVIFLGRRGRRRCQRGAVPAGALPRHRFGDRGPGRLTPGGPRRPRGRARRGRGAGRRGRGARRPARADAGGVRHGLLGVGHRDRRARPGRRRSSASTGWSPATARRTSPRISTCIHPDDRETVPERDRAPPSTARARSTSSSASSGRTARCTGPTAPAGSSATTAGRPIRMIGTGQDITERQRLVEERDRLLADERRAGEFREAFVDVISHELRTPITTILGPDPDPRPRPDGRTTTRRAPRSSRTCAPNPSGSTASSRTCWS